MGTRPRLLCGWMSDVDWCISDFGPRRVRKIEPANVFKGPVKYVESPKERITNGRLEGTAVWKVQVPQILHRRLLIIMIIIRIRIILLYLHLTYFI